MKRIPSSAAPRNKFPFKNWRGRAQISILIARRYQQLDLLGFLEKSFETRAHMYCKKQYLVANHQDVRIIKGSQSHDLCKGFLSFGMLPCLQLETFMPPCRTRFPIVNYSILMHLWILWAEIRWLAVAWMLCVLQ